MASRTRSPEEWIVFLLTLIDHTKDFKPDWEAFAQDTGLYKRGKFVRQAYNILREKHAPNINRDGNKNKADNDTIPKTPGARVTKAGKAGKAAAKRKQDLINNDHEDDLDDFTKSSTNKKRKTEHAANKGLKDGVVFASDDGESDHSAGNEKVHVNNVKDWVILG